METAVKTLNERRDLFDGYCKELIRSNRAAKKAALEAGGGKVDVSDPSLPLQPAGPWRLILSTPMPAADFVSCPPFCCGDVDANSLLRF
mgnify:CR=1 FL=1